MEHEAETLLDSTAYSRRRPSKGNGTTLRDARWVGRELPSTMLCFLIILAFFLTNLCSIMIAMNVAKYGHNEVRSDWPYSPANDHIKYEYRHIEKDPDAHLYMGRPRPEYEKAWDDLLEGSYIQVSREELLNANNATSIAHKDGGFVGGLAVGHNLHCLRKIRQFLHPEYYPLEKFRELDVRRSHLDHCLESLRQAMICNPDVSLNTLKWTPEQNEKITVTWPQANRCVNWEFLHSWLTERQASGSDFVRTDI